MIERAGDGDDAVDGNAMATPPLQNRLGALFLLPSLPIRLLLAASSSGCRLPTVSEIFWRAIRLVTDISESVSDYTTINQLVGIE